MDSALCQDADECINPGNIA